MVQRPLRGVSPTPSPHRTASTGVSPAGPRPVAAAGETRVTPDGGAKLTQPASLSQEFGKRTGGTFWWLAGGRGHWGSVWPVHSTEVNLERTELGAGMCPPHPLNKYLWGAYYVPGIGDSRRKQGKIAAPMRPTFYQDDRNDRQNERSSDFRWFLRPISALGSHETPLYFPSMLHSGLGQQTRFVGTVVWLGLV